MNVEDSGVPLAGAGVCRPGSYQDIGLSRISLCPGKAQAISSLMIFTKPDGGGDQVNVYARVKLHQEQER